jgi:hypothetical protein
MKGESEPEMGGKFRISENAGERIVGSQGAMGET